MKRILCIIWLFYRYHLYNCPILKNQPWFIKLIFRNPVLILLFKFNGIHKKYSFAQRTKSALIDLGPIFIKLGQILATRRDILSEEMANELSELFIKTKTIEFSKIKKIIEDDLNIKLEDEFAFIDEIPLGSASLAQVHAAQLHSGEKVAIKVIKPQVRELIALDVCWMKKVCHCLSLFSPLVRKFRIKQIIEQFEYVIEGEMNLNYEAANCNLLRRNFKNSPLIYFPKVYWKYVSKNIFISQQIFAHRINEIEEFKKANVNMQIVAEKGIQIFYTQVFRDGFFQADMHPGNVYIDITNPQNPIYTGVDFGMICSLRDNEKNYLLFNLLAFFKKDYYEIARLHIESKWVDENTPINQFEDAIRMVCEPFFEKPFVEISLGEVLDKLFWVGKKFNMQIQPQLAYLQKALISMEGLARELHPNLDMVKIAQPYLVQFVKKYISPLEVIKKTYRNHYNYIDLLPLLPSKIIENINQKKTNNLQQLELLNQINQTQKKLASTQMLLFLALMSISFILLLNQFNF